jgi:transcriptional regulator with XRE-family HTH domain
MSTKLHPDTTSAIHTLLARLSASKLSQRDFARRAHIDPSTITKLVYGMRPSVDALRAIVQHAPTPTDGISILIAHLRDEITRAQVHQDAIEIEPTGTAAPSDLTLADACSELRRIAKEDPPIRDLLIDLAVVVRAAHHATTRGLSIAAESSPAWSANPPPSVAASPIRVANSTKRKPLAQSKR